MADVAAAEEAQAAAAAAAAAAQAAEKDGGEEHAGGALPPAEQLAPQLALEVRAAYGQFLWQAGEPDKALGPLQRAVEDHHALHQDGKPPRAGQADPQATPLYAALGTSHYELGAWQEAFEWLTLAVEGGTRFYEPESPALGMLHFRAGMAASRLELTQSSLAHLVRARALWLPVAGKDPLLIQTQLAIALCHATLHDLDAAREAAEEAYVLGQEVLGGEHDITNGARELLQNLPPPPSDAGPGAGGSGGDGSGGDGSGGDQAK